MRVGALRLKSRLDVSKIVLDIEKELELYSLVLEQSVWQCTHSRQDADIRETGFAVDIWVVSLGKAMSGRTIQGLFRGRIPRER